MDVNLYPKKKPEQIRPLVENFKKNFASQFGVEVTPQQVKKWTAAYLAQEQAKFFMGWAESWNNIDMDGLESFFERPKEYKHPNTKPNQNHSKNVI